MSRSAGKISARVLFFRPADTESDWEKTDLWYRAAAIPGVNVMADPDAAEATRLGMLTSGHVLLYDRDGSLLFSGGITSLRGQHGESDGRRHILALVGGQEGDNSKTPVFGCPLHASTETNGSDLCPR